jgi:hypothetical protein
MSKTLKKLNLVDSADEEEPENPVGNEQRANKSKPNSSFELSINKNYADRYNNWREKEELQKCNFHPFLFRQNFFS